MEPDELKWTLGHPQEPGVYWFYLVDPQGGPYVRLVGLGVSDNGQWNYQQLGWAGKFGLYHLAQCLKHIPIKKPVM